MKNNTVFGAVDENEDKIEKFERIVGEQKKSWICSRKLLRSKTRNFQDSGDFILKVRIWNCRIMRLSRISSQDNKSH